MSETQIITGLFTNVASTPFFIQTNQQINEVFVRNLTQSDVTVGSIAGVTTGTRIVKAFSNPSYMNAGTALVEQVGTYSSSLAPLNMANLAQNGITIFNSFNPPTYAVVAISSFTQGTVAITSPASLTLQTTVFTTSTNHGYQVGDTVRVYGLTSAPQFSGLAMTVIATNGTNTFTTLLNSTGATTSVGSVQKTGNYLLPTITGTYPDNRVIAAITNTNPMYVTTLVQQNYFAGNVVTFDIPSVFGIPQLSPGSNGLPFQATVTVANNAVGAQTIALAVSATGFGVFGGANGWPASSSYPFGPPTMVPQGEGNLNNLQAYGVTPTPLPYANQDVLSFSKQGTGANGVLIGAGDGTHAATTGGIIGSSVDAWEFRIITSQQQYP